ncbi:MAG: hypothetical protein K2G26_04375 [Clostridia bacterium]|nr:hypothetical protein [Clostridia bacterium]
MENSEIYDILSLSLIHKWRDEIEASDECGFGADMHEGEQKICAILDEKQKKLLRHYAVSINNYLDFIYYQICIKVMNFGIKAGMELQATFNKE